MLGGNRHAAKSGKTAGRRDQLGQKDYRIYRMGGSDILLTLGEAFGLAILIAFLFYRNVWGMLVVFVTVPLFYKNRRKKKCREQQQRLRQEFKECIRLVTASLYSGYSVENAFGAAQQELTELLGEEADMCQELWVINQQIKLNRPVEAVLQELAERSGVEEIFSFGQVFGYAKRMGSNFAKILKDTSDRIGEKVELEREIRTMIAGKQMEQRIMNIIPLGILIFVEVTSPGFLQVMYEGLLGRTIMTACLVLYGAAFLLSEKLADIRI